MGDSMIRLALRWLAHPVSLAAIVVMVVNDHVLKQAFGTWWTGKLSDVAGLVFFPAVVAVAVAAVSAGLSPVSVSSTVRRPTRAEALPQTDLARLVFLATAITAIGFTWVKATAHGAATASAVLTEIAGPSVVRLDVTDLLALPVLGLAAWVGLGASRLAGAAGAGGEAQRAGRARKSLAVAALPLALFASVATSQGDDELTRVEVKDKGDGSWVASFGWGGYADYRLTDSGWVQVDYGDADDERRFHGETQREDCVPSNSNVCFRIVGGTMAVEKSTDGGDTWKDDWQLTSDQMRTLQHAYGVSRSDIATTSVGVASVRGGYVVVAANGTDGLAIRDVDGEWTRVGFAPLECCADVETVDFATLDTLPGVHVIPVGVAMGVGLAMLALPFLGAALRRGIPGNSQVLAYITGAVFYLIGAGFGVTFLRGNGAYGALDRYGVGFERWLLYPLTIVATVGILSGVAALGYFRGRAVLAIAVGWLSGACLAGFVAETAGGGWLREAAFGVAALAVLYALYVPFARRWWVKHVPPRAAEWYPVAPYPVAPYPAHSQSGVPYPVAPDQVQPYPVMPYPVAPDHVQPYPVMPPPVMPPAPAAVPPSPPPLPEQEHRGNP